MTRLLLVRHAESVWNAKRRWQGTGDPPLSEAGRAEARTGAEALDGSIEAVVSSPLRRARETAEVLVEGRDLAPITIDEDLREVDVGAWTGLTLEQVQRRYPFELEQWRSRTARSAPGGEDLEAFSRRIQEALARVARSHQGSSVLVVTHGGVIGRLERDLDCYAGGVAGHLDGRWFTFDEGLRPHGGRVHLLAR